MNTSRTQAGHVERQKHVDPLQGAWQTEAFAKLAKGRLKQIGKLLEKGERIEANQLASFTASHFSCSELRPAELQEVFGDGALTVFRPRDDVSFQRSPPSKDYLGSSGLATALRALALGQDNTGDMQVHFKLFRVEAVEDFPNTVGTFVFYEASGRTTRGVVQQNATWECHWSGSDGEPQLSWIGLRDYEEIVLGSASQTMFADCTEAVLGDNPSFQEQLLYGTDHWRDRIERHLGIYIQGHEGLALGDANGDLLEDVYLCQPGGLPNRLFIQRADGTVRDTSAAAGVDLLDKTRCALFVDLDNDGDQDLAVATHPMLVILSNDGQGHFTVKVRLPSGGDATSLTAADYDKDGDLDLYVGRYRFARGHYPVPVPYHDANNGAANILLQNEGNWKFVDVTRTSGLDQNNMRFTLASSWEDYDNDGDVDLYVANDFGRNNLYRNDGGRFTDVASEAAVEDVAAGMSVTFADYNRDGRMDIYVSNMFSAAGGRVAYQRRFFSEADGATRSLFQRHARGNTLFENVGDGTFRDVSVQAAVTMGRWAWGSLFVDVNNDGWEDLLVANGFYTGQGPDDL